MTAADPSVPKPPQAPPDEAVVAETVRTRLPFHAQFKALAPLAGDASNRRYFRIQLGAGTFPSLVLMQLAEPEAFKQSEEAVSGGAAPPTELPFVNVHRHLIQAQVPVPQLYHYDQEAGLLYLEDLGDVTLAQACENGAGDQTPGFYRYAVDVLVNLHLKATFPPEPACVAFGRAFDVPLLMWEFDHFIEYGIEKRNGRLIPEADRQAIRNDMQKVAGLLAGLPQVFTHRDYHSRNLMVREGRLRVIDFQDALMGPATYDLASLLRDSYVALDEELIAELVIRYLEGRAKAGAPLDRLTFMRLFDLTSIQRNLKAAGRFVYIDQVKGNPKFLADIPRTLGYVRRNLAKYPETASLRKRLAAYVPELQ
ncbi:MAG: aminoglycoside phosphotransferase [Nitrospirae bacterium]|nr:MAG: aminoglycoside phosphotransferase [Nitrospirota bacterium]